MGGSMFYIYVVDGGFIKIPKNSLDIKMVKKIDNASYWINKKSAKSWLYSIKYKYPSAKLKEATLKLI